jgi:hypothetical protein
MNKKCSSCGFINFVTAEQCKKCEAVLTPIDETQALAYVNYSAAQPQGYVAPPNQPKVGRQILTAFAYVFLGLFLLSMFFSGWKSLLPSLRSREVKWIEYRPEGIDMTVMMPNEPTKFDPLTTPLSIGSMTNHTFISGVPGQGDAVFCVIDYTADSSLFKPELESRMMDAELTDFLKRTNAILISKNYVPYKGIVALEFVTQPLAGPAKVYGKMFMLHSSLYFFTITAKDGSELFAGRDKFLNPLMPKNTNPYQINIDSREATTSTP